MARRHGCCPPRATGKVLPTRCIARAAAAGVSAVTSSTRQPLGPSASCCSRGISARHGAQSTLQKLMSKGPGSWEAVMKRPPSSEGSVKSQSSGKGSSACARAVRAALKAKAVNKRRIRARVKGKGMRGKSMNAVCYVANMFLRIGVECRIVFRKSCPLGRMAARHAVASFQYSEIPGVGFIFAIRVTDTVWL